MTAFSDQPAIVELFGHAVIAGLITEEEHFGTTMLRVDVPGVDGQPAFTKFYGQGAVYAITPTDEQTMLAAVQFHRVRPIVQYRLSLPDPQLPLFDDDDDDDEHYRDQVGEYYD